MSCQLYQHLSSDSSNQGFICDKEIEIAISDKLEINSMDRRWIGDVLLDLFIFSHKSDSRDSIVCLSVRHAILKVL